MFVSAPPSAIRGRAHPIVLRLKALAPYRAARFVAYYLFSSDYRADRALRRSAPANLFQANSFTSVDRYAAIFQFVRNRIGDGPDRRILSFGCSTGQEIVSLHGLFPQAVIKGIDISARNIAHCRKLLAGIAGRTELEVAGSADGESPESYDAVFCMAVLRHEDLSRPGTLSCDRLLKFEDFERTVGGLGRCLKPGGMLVIRFSNFRFCDTAAFADFEPVLSVQLAGNALDSPFFGPDNRLMKGEHYADAAFYKRHHPKAAANATGP